MAIDVFTKAWSIIPPPSARPLTGHPLCPRFGFIFNDGRVTDIVRGTPVISAGATPGTWSPGSCRRYAGRVREHTATSDFDRINIDANLVIPAQEITIVLGYEKTDATLRAATAIGSELTTSTSFLMNCYVPDSDGVVKFDFGGEDAAHRVSVGSLTFGDDVWAFTCGPREQAIYQNGIQRVSVAAQNPTKGTWGGGTENIAFGKHKGGANASDLAKWKFAYIYWRQLGVKEIEDVSRDPFQWVDPRS